MMKATTSTPLLLCFLANSLFSQSNLQQSLSVNNTGAAADASAQLDVSATDKGMLVPRMTSAQRTAIASPATGLLVFDTDNGSFWFYNGTSWSDLSAPNTLADADGDTKIQVEKNPDEDRVRIDLAGSERLVVRQNANGRTLIEFPNNGDNLFLGTSTGNANSTGDNNTAIGKSSLADNTSASSNTAIGAFSLSNNTVGADNTGIGAYVLVNNLDGNGNTASGYGALGANTSGDQNTAVGKDALSANLTNSNNTAVGFNALQDNTSFSNTAVGSGALQENTSGDANTAVGNRALRASLDGFENTAVGDDALLLNTSGSRNTALGANALFNSSSGSSNTAIGHGALDANTTGSNNTALGYQSTVASGNLSNATAVGAQAEVSANNCLVLGSINGVNGASASVNVGIGISNPALRLHIQGGSDATVAGGGYIQTGGSTGNNVAIDENEILARNNGATSTLFLNNDGGDVKIGNSSSNVGVGRTPITNNLEVEGTASKSSAGDWLANSDARLKKNISPLNSREMLEKLLSLQGITYEWNDDKTGSKRPEGIQYGFTAQNIQQVFPTLVEEDKMGYLQTAYGTYDAMVVEAIRALYNKIESLEAENTSLQNENEKLAGRLAKLEASVFGSAEKTAQAKN